MDMIEEGQRIAREAARMAAAPRPGGYLACRVGSEEYAVDILGVQEIRSYEAPTRLPGAPAHVKGVINLRGAIVPVVDLRLRLGCASAPYDATTVVIVLATRARMTGLVVDAVSDVLELAAADILPPPGLAEGAVDDFVTGIAGLDGRLLLMMDLERLVGPAAGAPELPSP